MAKRINLLVDTDIFIDYFNHRLFKGIFESDRFRVFYSVVTKKELLSKQGLSLGEQKMIRRFLRGCRIIPLDPRILQEYSDLRGKHPVSEKEDCLIAATAIIKKIPLATRNLKHFRIFKELVSFF